jgi:hypothetical protein
MRVKKLSLLHMLTKDKIKKYLNLSLKNFYSTIRIEIHIRYSTQS